MELLKYIKTLELTKYTQVERAKMLCFYLYKSKGIFIFDYKMIREIFIDAGFKVPNTTTLKVNLVKNGIMKEIKKTKSIEFTPIAIQTLIVEYGNLWEDYENIDSNSEFLDETKFCKKRTFLDKIIKQINKCYAANCYDATAVLLRRLFEILLILAFQHNNIDNEIKSQSGHGYMMLDDVVKKAKMSSTLKLSRITNEYDSFRLIGNFSAHNITYTAGKSDIDQIKLNYRVMLEELYNKSGLIK
jgi:hypothetical protein